jgi:hypothetical protein
MQCLEFSFNGQRIAVAGGESTRSIEARVHFFPPHGRGSFTVSGYADPGPSLSEQVSWTDGELKLGDELHVRVVESNAADRGEVLAQWGESASHGSLEQTCLFCGKRKSEAQYFMVAKAGAICGECISGASEAMKSLTGV